VLLYELLTGSTPFDTNELLTSGLDEMRKIIRERQPVRPSTRLRQTASLRISSAQRPRFGLALSTDLDWIVMKCLEKDRGGDMRRRTAWRWMLSGTSSTSRLQPSRRAPSTGSEICSSE